MRAARQHDMWQGFELVADGLVDAGIAVAKQIDPPRADAVKIALAFVVKQPRPLATGYG